MLYRCNYILTILLSILLLSCSTSNKAKPTLDISKENVKVVTQTSPVIIGGMEALYQQLNYPANTSQQTADIILEANILVDNQGKVKQISFDTDQYPQYKKSAREAIYSVRFVPGKRNGKTADMFITIPIQFKAR